MLNLVEQEALHHQSTGSTCDCSLHSSAVQALLSLALGMYNNTPHDPMFLQLVLFGPRVAIAMPDCRSERTRHQVLSLETHLNLVVKVTVSGGL